MSRDEVNKKDTPSLPNRCSGDDNNGDETENRGW